MADLPIGKAMRRLRRSRVSAFLARVSARDSVEVGGFRLVLDRAGMDRRLVADLHRGDYEAKERTIVSRLLRPGDRVLEGGAGMGVVTMTIARIVGAPNVLAFEASPRTAGYLQRNLAANGLQVTVRRAALAAEDGEMTFFANPNVLSSSLHERSGATAVTVQAHAVGPIVAAFAPNVLVLDIEGAEIEVVEAAPLDGVDLMIVEIHPHVRGSQAYVRLYRRAFDAGFFLSHEASHGAVVTFMKPGRG